MQLLLMVYAIAMKVTLNLTIDVLCVSVPILRLTGMAFAPATATLKEPEVNAFVTINIDCQSLRNIENCPSDQPMGI